MDNETIEAINKIAKETMDSGKRAFTREVADEIAYKQALQTSTVFNKTEFENTYEFGSAGNRFKLYFKDAADLLNKVKELREKGFAVEIAAGL